VAGGRAEGGVDASVLLLLLSVRGPLFLSSFYFVLGFFVPFSLSVFFHGVCFINVALLLFFLIEDKRCVTSQLIQAYPKFFILSACHDCGHTFGHRGLAR